MAQKLVVYDDTTQTCGHATLTPYPAVVAGTNTTVTSSTGSDGKVTYTVNAAGGGGATHTPCDQAWQQTKLAGPQPNVGQKQYLFNPTTVTQLADLYDAETGDVVKSKLVDTLCWTRAELQSYGMRATDNSVRFKTYAMVRANLQDLTSTLPIDFMTRMELWIEDGTAALDSIYASDTTTPTTGTEPATYLKDSISEYHTVTLPAGRGICMKVYARVVKGSSTQLSGTESMTLQNVRFSAAMELLEFFRADTGVPIIDGCL